MSDTVVQHRRTLHRIPELDDQLPKTVAYVRSVLEPLGAKVFSPIPGSVCAYFDCGRETTLALRADMDALPIPECTGLPYCSEHQGNMHACGHDGHTAIELSVAQWVARELAEGRDFPRNILFVFQPAEETTGGAGRLCATGVLNAHRVERLFGLHLWPGVPVGRVITRPGPMMARSNEVTLEVVGKSVHVSRAQEGLDAMRAATTWMERVYAYADGLPPEVLRVVQFGQLTAGTVRNAVAGQARLLGTLRTYETSVALAMQARMRELAAEVATQTGCTLQLHFSSGYPAVWNHEGLYESVREALGEDVVGRLDAPVLAAEDFSFYQEAVPAVFFFLGVGQTEELHSPKFVWDDETVLPAGVEFVKRLTRLP